MIPCPRHRLPKYNSDSDLREMSSVIFKLSELKLTGRFVLKLFTLLKIVKYEIVTKDGQEYIEINNLTLINFILYICGPLHEQTLTVVLLLFQIVCSGIAFGIRYPLALKFYGEIIAWKYRRLFLYSFLIYSMYHTIRKVKFLSKNSILTKPQHFGEFFT